MRALVRAGAPVRFYEDYPYSGAAGSLEARLARLGAAFAVERVDVTPWLERRIRAIGAYTSQLRALFRPDGRVPGPYQDAVSRFAANVAGEPSRFAECLFTRIEASGP